MKKRKEGKREKKTENINAGENKKKNEKETNEYGRGCEEEDYVNSGGVTFFRKTDSGDSENNLQNRWSSTPYTDANIIRR